jgi:hypothetical protein
MTGPEIHPAVDAKTRQKRASRHRKWKATRALLIRVAVVFVAMALIGALRTNGLLSFDATLGLALIVYTWLTILVGGWIQIITGRTDL